MIRELPLRAPAPASARENECLGCAAVARAPLAQVSYQGQGTAHVLSLHSQDGGVTWTEPEQLPWGHGAFVRNQASRRTAATAADAAACLSVQKRAHGLRCRPPPCA